MAKCKVLKSDLYTSKNTGRQSWRCTAISDDGPLVFFAKYEDHPKPGDIYSIDVRYDAYAFGYKPKYTKQQ